MGDQQAEHRGREDRGHAFQDVEGILRCGHCGQTAENFRTYRNDCAVPQCHRYEEPAPGDRYAVICWETGAASFWRDADEGEAFRKAQDARYRWLGPLPLASLNPTPHRHLTHISFEQYLLKRGQPRDARSVNVGETLTETITELELPLPSLPEFYLREDHLWTQLEQSAKDEPGHFITDLADPEPNRVLSQVACDMDRIARAAGYGPGDSAKLFHSANLHLHIARFATTLARYAPEDVIDRGLYWVLLNCHFYARHLADGIGEVGGQGSQSTIRDSVLQSNRYRASTWDEVALTFLSDERIQISTPALSETLNYEEFGLGNSKTGKPKEAWQTLREMAESRGLIQPKCAGRERARIEKRVQELRSVFRRSFDITADPISFVPGNGYQARFRISCAPSFNF